MIVTLDGPAGSGKSTTAREVARRLGYRHLDSGSFYRALTFHLLEQGIAEDRWSGLSAADLAAVPLRIEPVHGGFEVRMGDRILTSELRSHEVTSRVPKLASFPAVRAWLMRFQHRVAEYGPLVADGRDMGTKVFPKADVKFFLTADLRERAKRRLRDQGIEAPTDLQVDREAEGIAARDRTDTEREHSPLVRPEGATEVDTTALSFQEQVDAIVARVLQVDPSRSPV